MLPAVLDGFAPLSIVLLDEDLQVRWVSSASMTSPGRAPDGVPGRRFRDLMRPGMVTDEVEALLRRGLVRREDATLMLGDGRERDFVAFPVDVDGHPHVGLVTVMITAANHRQLDEYALRESLLADAAQLGVWRLDLSDNSLHGNSWYTTVNDVGTPETPRFRRDMARRIHPDDLPRVNATVDRAVETGEPYTMKYRLVGPNGETKTVQSRGRVVPGRPDQVIGVVMDVTASETAVEREAALRQLAATASDAERDRIAAELHDGPLQQLAAAWLRLAALEGAAVSLSGTEGGADDVRTGIRAVTGMLAGINGDLRDLMGRLRTLPVGSSTDEFRDEVFDLAERAAERGGLEVRVVCEFEADLALPGTVLSTMYRIIGEALSNAERHARATCVSVSVELFDRSLVASIVDDGRGFDTSAPRPSGHFGLSVMRQRAAAARGTVDITSSVGGGTSVVVRLPLDADPG